jgi:hypothetical protein
VALITITLTSKELTSGFTIGIAAFVRFAGDLFFI